MTAKGKAILFGFLIWLTAFIVALLIFPIRESARPLFESIMPVVVTTATAVFTVVYVRGLKAHYLREAILLGCLWLVMNVLIDAPLMLFGGPMKMSVGQYVADIGLTYLIIPAVTIGIGLGCERVSTTSGNVS